VRNYQDGTCQSLCSEGPNGGSNAAGEWTHNRTYRKRGITHEDEFQERRTGKRQSSGGRESVRCNGWRSRGDTKFMKDASNVHSSISEGLYRKDPEGQLGNEKRSGGSATKANRVATECSQ